MRIVVHDYTGHPFQVQLSRELARRDHEVLHLYSASFQTPHGALAKSASDPPTFDVEGVALPKPFAKYSYRERRRQEIEYGGLVAQRIKEWRPDAVVSANTPIEAQKSTIEATRRVNGRFIFWVQDVYSIAVHRLLRRRLPIAGEIIGRIYMRIEKRLLRESDAIVLISEDFRAIMKRWRVDPRRLHVIENWAPLDEMPMRPKDNPWSRELGLHDKTCLLYSGTLGMKHNPNLLLQLAIKYKDDAAVRVVVISEGPGADWLSSERDKRKLENLILLDYQPFERMPEVLATGDVLMAILEPDAGVFSVPSKVLTYLCAGRPLLLAVPPENLAARIVVGADAGLVVSPRDAAGFVASAGILLEVPELREQMAKNARRYADEHFDIKRIGDRFEALLSDRGH